MDEKITTPAGHEAAASVFSDAASTLEIYDHGYRAGVVDVMTRLVTALDHLAPGFLEDIGRELADDGEDEDGA
jgi:hypothetical protein